MSLNRQTCQPAPATSAPGYHLVRKNQIILGERRQLELKLTCSHLAQNWHVKFLGSYSLVSVWHNLVVCTDDVCTDDV